jgi:hypothetical protein
MSSSSFGRWLEIPCLLLLGACFTACGGGSDGAANGAAASVVRSRSEEMCDAYTESHNAP